MTTGCYETSFLLFANARGAETLLTVKFPAPGTHRETNARGLPGGVLAVGIDTHITMFTIGSKLNLLCICYTFHGQHG